MSDHYLNPVFHSSDPPENKLGETEEAPPTRAESLGHKPRQAAGDLGPGEVVVVEALDGGDDEGPSHPSVVCRISHLLLGVGIPPQQQQQQQLEEQQSARG